MKFSCVSLCFCLLHICFPFQKKLHLDFFSVSFCSAFPASNSLQIFQLIPCKSLWDLICLVSWDDKIFSLLNSASPIFSHRQDRNHSVAPKQKTRCYRFHNWAKFCHLHPPFLSSTCITFYMLLCHVTQGPNLFTTNSRSPSWKLMSKGEREITSKLII